MADDLMASTAPAATVLNGTDRLIGAQGGLDAAFPLSTLAKWIIAQAGLLLRRQSAVPVVLTGTVSETYLAIMTIPGGTIGPNGSIRVTTLWTMTGSANKTARVRLGVSTVQANQLTASSYHRMQCEIHNVNSQASQKSTSISAASFGSGNGLNPTLTTVNTAVDVDIVISATLTSASDSMTLESYLIEIMPGE